MHVGPDLASRSLLRKALVFVIARAFLVVWAAIQRAGEVGARYATSFALVTRPLVITRKLFAPAGNTDCMIVLLFAQLVEMKATGSLFRAAHDYTSSTVVSRVDSLKRRSSNFLATIAVERRTHDCSRTAAPTTW